MEQVVPKLCCGFSSSAVQFVSSSEVARQCGNTLVLLDIQSQRQRLLTSGGHGIQGFCCSAKAGLIAVAEQGQTPRISIYRESDLKQLQSLQADAESTYTAVALSGDGELLAVCSGASKKQLSVWHWRKAAKLAAAAIPHAVASISFHPADASIILTVPSAHNPKGGEPPLSLSDHITALDPELQLWRLEKLWSRHELLPSPVQLPPGCVASCHAWAPEGIYLGCNDGTILCVDPTSAVCHGKAQTSTGGVISSITVNKDAVAVASSSVTQLAFFQRAVPLFGDKQQQQAAPELQLIGSVVVSTQGCACVCFGGTLHKDLVVSTTDGSLLLLTRGTSSRSPADVQVEPLADYHIGPITGIAAAPDHLHFLSCGSDGSVRAWAAESGQLVGKRLLGGKLTCCAVATGSTAIAAPGKPLLVVGSEAGVVRLISLTELQRLPVMYRCRLHKSAVTHAAFSPSGDCLVTAAAADKHVALLGLRGCEHTDMLGYFPTAEPILDVCWYSSSTDRQAYLLISTSDGSLITLMPPAQPYNNNAQQQNSLGEAADALQLKPSDVTAMCAKAEVPLLCLAALPAGNRPATGSDSGSSNQQQRSSTHIIGLGSDGQLHRLMLPESMTDWTSLKGRPLRSTSRIVLPAQGSALAVSPGGQSMVIACQDGSILTLPAASAAATAAAMAAMNSSSSTSGSRTAGSGRVVAHGSGDSGGAAGVVAWGTAGQWVASGAGDGSLLLHAVTGLMKTPEPLEVVQFDSTSIEDVEAIDDVTVPTLAETAAAAAALEAENAGAPARQATLQKIQELQRRLNEIRQANAAAPPEHRLSEAELVLDLGRLERMRAQVDAEVAEYIAKAEAEIQATEAKAQELKSLCWDSMQTKGALCTGLKSGSIEVNNFPLPAQDEARWAKVANLRRTETVRAAAEGFAGGAQQDTTQAAAVQGRDAGSVPMHPSTTGASTIGDADSSAGFLSSAGASTRPCSTAGSIAASDRESVRESMITNATLAQQLLARIGNCEASDCKAEDLLYPELDVTYPGRKRVQAELYKRMVWELKTQFNKEFDQLKSQKHRDSDRLTDLVSRMDELIRELVQIHILLNPAAASSHTTSGSAAAHPEQSAMMSAQAAVVGTTVDSVRSSTAGPPSPTARVSTMAAAGVTGVGAVVTAEQLAAELSVGRLVAHWSPLEDMEDMLFNIKPGEVKAPKYQSAAERAKLAAEQAAAEEARRKAASDDATERALKQMMGGKLERTVDEVADLVASRPAWMNDDPATFTEEQLKEYKEYCAKEQAAIEERLKRKSVMETELRTLKASADDIATKFDEAVAALAAKRIDLLIEITALECRIMRLLADYETVTVTAGYEAEQKAVEKLQAVQEQLAALDRELAETQELRDQQQSALNSVQAEARAHDRGLKSELAEADSASMTKLVSLYKHRIAPAATDTAAGRVASASSAGGAAAARVRPGSAAAVSPPGSAELEFTPPSSTSLKGAAAVAHGAAGGGAAAAAAAASGAGSSTGGFDMFGPLGPAPVQITVLSDAQMPESLELSVWERFLQYRIARGQMDISIRDLSAKLVCLQHQHELLQSRQTEKAGQVAAAAEELEALRTKRAAAMFDVELQLRLKQGQVECSPEGVSANNPDAVLINREQVVALNTAILAKGQAKLDLMKQMKEFKRGIYQLEWENKKIDMQAADIISLTQQLQLLHVTKDFQQLVKSSRTNKPTGSSSNATAAAAAGGGDSGGQSAAATEVQRLQKLLQVREDLHKKAVAQKQRQLKQIEAQIAAKRRENASVALHLQGLDKVMEDHSRLEGAVAEDPGTDRVMRNLMMQRQLQDIAAAQAAEIAAAQAELEALQKRSFPCFPTQGSAGNSGISLIPIAAPAAGNSNVQSPKVALPAAGRLPVLGSNMGGNAAAQGDAFAPSGSRKGKLAGSMARSIGPDAKPGTTASHSAATAARTGKLAAP